MRTPVTVLTGFLGSGKTTLLNRILTENHGLRIAVIENEFGELGVDNHLVIQADEEIFEMNNGCICCTVRGDLIRILGRLAEKKDKFDRVLIETTGLADPGPVAQTFFVDEDVKKHFELDGIVTLVDAKHVLQHLDDSSECQEQIAFADRILLNKVDLVPSSEIEELKNRIQALNEFAPIYPCEKAEVDIKVVLGVGGFKLDRALEIKPQFLAPQYAFEWVGFFDLPVGNIDVVTGPSATDSLPLALVATTTTADEAGFLAVERHGSEIYRGKGKKVYSPKGIEATSPTLWDLKRAADKPKVFPIEGVQPGRYAVFAGSCPHDGEFYLTANGNKIATVWSKHFHNHRHDSEVGSVSFQSDRALDPEKFNRWISKLLQTQGGDIFRSKGILNLSGHPNPYVFQAVHMMVDGSFDERGWGDSSSSQVVFIGRNLDREALEKGFERCLV
jgi:G3E family GTPase